VQQLGDEALGCFRLDPPRLAGTERCGVGIDGAAADRQRLAAPDRQVVGGNQNAGGEAQEIDGAGAERSFVEVVDVVVDQAVVALVAAHVLQVQVATQPGVGSAPQQGGAGQPLVEQVAGAAQELERVVADGAQLHRQALGVPAAVEGADAISRGHARPFGCWRSETVTRRSLVHAPERGPLGYV
jgi:hypothetical protein